MHLIRFNNDYLNFDAVLRVQNLAEQKKLVITMAASRSDKFYEVEVDGNKNPEKYAAYAEWLAANSTLIGTRPPANKAAKPH